MKLSDNEIVKFVEHAMYSAKGEEGFKEIHWEHFKDILDLINRLKEENDDLSRIVGLGNKRQYYRKFVDEVFRKQKGKELSDPDYDYIYQLYFEQQAEIERLNRELTNSEMAHSELLMIYDSKCAQLRRYQEREYKLMKELAELIKVEFYKEFDELIPSIMSDKIDNLLAELTSTLNKLPHNSLCETETYEGDLKG